MRDDAERCNIKHGFSDARCIRPIGHDGRCWSKSVRASGTITRCEWYSENGRFQSHYQYDTKYPANANRSDKQ